MAATESDVFCARASLEVGEPLSGTAAAETARWLILEHDGPWGPKGVQDSGLPSEVVAHLNALGAAFPDLRVQLIRRHEEIARGGSKLFLARTDESLGELYEGDLPEPSALPRLGLEAWLKEGVLPAGFRALKRPLYLVCAHGKRDRCCALRGMPLYNALRERASDQVWQTTHLGGHRFAATMVVLPHGICYGRLSEHDASGLYDAHQSNEFYALDKVRGRTRYGAAEQAAEVALRERLGERRLDALVLAGSEPIEGGTRVRFLLQGRQHEVDLQRVVVPEAPASCGATPKPGEGLLALRTR